MHLLPNKQFIKDYRLPLEATFVFVALLVVMLLSRTFERLALADVLADKSGGNYGTLVSNDKIEDLTKSNEGTTETSQTTSSSEPLTVSSGGSSGGGGGDGGNEGGGGTEPDPEFSAAIEGLVLESTSMQCSGSGTNMECFKRYVFRAMVSTVNGPGTVVYAWQGSEPEIPITGNFSVGSGATLTPVIRDFKLRCVPLPRQFTIRLILTEPNSAQSNTLQQIHECGTIPPPTGP